jgi:hypothetical protein
MKAGVITLRAFALFVTACSSPEPQNGTNTNWACNVDSDCKARDVEATCEQGRCAVKQLDSGAVSTDGASAASVLDGAVSAAEALDSCQSDRDCADGVLCNGAEKCVDVTSRGRTTKRCVGGSPLADGTQCGDRSICEKASCVAR